MKNKKIFIIIIIVIEKRGFGVSMQKIGMN